MLMRYNYFDLFGGKHVFVMLMNADYQAIKEPDALNLCAIVQMRGNDNNMAFQNHNLNNRMTTFREGVTPVCLLLR